MKERTDFEKLFLLATNANDAIGLLVEELQRSYRQPWHKRLFGLMPDSAKAARNKGQQVQKFLGLWGATNSG